MTKVGSKNECKGIGQEVAPGWAEELTLEFLGIKQNDFIRNNPNKNLTDESP